MNSQNMMLASLQQTARTFGIAQPQNFDADRGYLNSEKDIKEDMQKTFAVTIWSSLEINVSDFHK